MWSWCWEDRNKGQNLLRHKKTIFRVGFSGQSRPRRNGGKGKNSGQKIFRSRAIHNIIHNINKRISSLECTRIPQVILPILFMDKKEVKQAKDTYVALRKKYIHGLAEIKGERDTEIAREMAERLNNFITGKMNPDSMVKRITIKDALPNSIFKEYVHTPLQCDLQNKVTFSAVQCRRKLRTADLFFTSTYNIYNAEPLRPFLPTLFDTRVGLDADFSLLMVDMDWTKQFIMKYNWDEQEITLDFVIKRFRGNLIDGVLVGNPI